MGFAIFPEPIQVLVLTSTHYPAGIYILADSGFSVKYRHFILLISHLGRKISKRGAWYHWRCLRRFYLWNLLKFQGSLLSCSLESNLRSRLFCNRRHRKPLPGAAMPKPGVMRPAFRPAISLPQYKTAFRYMKQRGLAPPWLMLDRKGGKKCPERGRRRLLRFTLRAAVCYALYDWAPGAAFMAVWINCSRQASLASSD